MRYVIGIDISTTKTGLSVFQIKDHKLIYKKHFLFEAEKANYTKKSKMSKKEYKDKKHQEIRKRSLYMSQCILDKLEIYCPEYIIVEDTYAQNDIHTLKWLSRLQGVILAFSLQSNCKLIFKTPSEWRKEVGIKTREGRKVLKRPILKEQAIQLVKKYYHLDVTDDEADAILIGLSGQINLEKK